MNYRPELKPITVPLKKLLLDPNNPRFLEDHATRVPEKEFADSGVQIETAKRMEKEAFRLDQLKQSILTNGWQPVDMIFVRRLEELPGQYVVLEGNRRLMALLALQQSGDMTPALLAEIDPLHVLEVVGSGNLEESRAQITYLLGVRHHGSLKTWGPFAQAHNLYERYLQEGAMTDATFQWDVSIAEKIGARLSVEVKTIEERLRTYIAMKQLNDVPAICSVGIKGRYYSLVRAVLPPGTPSSPLRKYVVQDPSTFKLDDQSLSRLDAVCHFSTEKRAGAPVKSPDEWRPLAKILGDADSAKSAEMLRQVEVEKRSPSDVSAERQAELRQPRWDRWLTEVRNLLKRLQVGNIDSEDVSAVQVGTRLAAVLDALTGITATQITSEKN